MTAHETSRSGRRRAIILRVSLLILVVATALGLAYAYGSSLSLDSLAARESELRQLYRDHPVATIAVAFLLYVAVTGLSIPVATGMSLAYGWLFGFWTGVLLVSFASTTGASIAFLMSRYLIGSWVQSRFAERLAAFNQAMEREGAFYLFTLRLVPAVPFFVINVVMGLTKIRLRTFWWVSQLGMLPVTCVFLWAGASAPSIAAIKERGVSSVLNLNVILALTALGVFPLAMRQLLKFWQRRR